jgi:hypothetical protein
MPKAEETIPVFPNQPVSRRSHRILSLPIMVLRMRYRTFVAYIILFLKANKKGVCICTTILQSSIRDEK